MNNAAPHVPIPRKLQLRPFDPRGYLIPWFVGDGPDGKPDFRTMDGKKWHRAVTEKLCWLCGQPLGVYKVFVSGPMCGINRTTSEPPCHQECAMYAVQACPFLVDPSRPRRVQGLPHDATDAPGLGLARNPGVALMWYTPDFTVFRAAAGTQGFLIRMGEPSKVEFYREGRAATAPEIIEAVQSGLPTLADMAHLDPDPRALKMFTETIDKSRRYFPAGTFDIAF